MKKRLIRSVPKLSERAREFDVANTELSMQLMEDLCDTLQAKDDRLYLTSNQIGYSERALAIKFEDRVVVMFNPVIVERDTMIIFREKDWLTGKEYFIPRFTNVTVNYQDIEAKPKALKMNEAASIIICEAMDALNGILVQDYGLEIIPEFDEASEDEKAEVLAAYTESLMKTSKELDNELSTDEETKEQWNGAKFLKGISEGTIELEKPELSNRKKKKLNKFLKTLKKIGGKH